MYNLAKNLKLIISELNLTNVKASELIGISNNTLTNILNNNKETSRKTIEQIERFLKQNNIETEKLYANPQSNIKFRIRVRAELSGNQKSALNRLVITTEDKITQIKNGDKNWEEYFDIYTLPYKNNDLFYSFDRLNEFRNIIKEKKINSPKQLINYILNNKDKEFWGNFYYPIGFAHYSTIDYLVNCLNIGISILPFGTEKIESFSTSINEDCPQILINSDVCKTAESQTFAICKEFYHIVVNQDEYSDISYNDYVIEKNNVDAEKFAELFLLKRKDTIKIIDQLKKIDAVKAVLDLKHDAMVSYKLILKYLREKKLTNMTDSDFLKQLETIWDCTFKENQEPFSENYRSAKYNFLKKV